MARDAGRLKSGAARVTDSVGTEVGGKAREVGMQEAPTRGSPGTVRAISTTGIAIGSGAGRIGRRKIRHGVAAKAVMLGSGMKHAEVPAPRSMKLLNVPRDRSVTRAR